MKISRLRWVDGSDLAGITNLLPLGIKQHDKALCRTAVLLWECHVLCCAKLNLSFVFNFVEITKKCLQ